VAARLTAAWEGLPPLRLLRGVLRRWRAAAALPPATAAPAGGTDSIAATAPGPAARPASPGGNSLAAAIQVARSDFADKLWGTGFLMPGGEPEIARLANLLPISPATTLLMVGRDAGGAAEAVGRLRGAWLEIHQSDAQLNEWMTRRLSHFGRRAQVHPWNPAAPAFKQHWHNHALALEPLRIGAEPETMARAIAAAMKPGGQLVLVETVAREPPPDHIAAFKRWLALEERTRPPHARSAVDLALNLAGFTVHVVEDLGARQCIAATEAWARMLGGLKGQHRPSGAGDGGRNLAAAPSPARRRGGLGAALARQPAGLTPATLHSPPDSRIRRRSARGW